ncbi:MAG: deoxyribose-phosphate aldolase [Planctomycetota bacterium]
MSNVPRTRTDLARFIDHTVLKPDTTPLQIDQLCEECLEYGFYAACVNPIWVPRCVRRLSGGDTSVASVAGFPLGASTTPAKALEAQMAVDQGALEVDMVVNLGALIGGDEGSVTRDIATVVAAAKQSNTAALVKVILETRALNDDHIILGCRCAAQAGADFVKTSTGFYPAGGATVEHVALMHTHAAPLKVKAAGGIRNLETALAMIAAGADRLGLSAGVAVVAALPR